jgi:ArsR family transcriptional regulator
MTEQALALTSTPDDIDAVVRLGKAVGDRLRASILQVLHQESYSVGELCSLFDVPQPALSHHLKILHQAGLAAKRREGNSIFYRRASLPPDSAAAAVLELLDHCAPGADLASRIAVIHGSRNRRSADFFARNAAEIAARQAEICEPPAYADLVMEMAEAAVAEGLPTKAALEVGPGSGELLIRLAVLFDAVSGVDSSRSMLNAARGALPANSTIRLRHQDFMTLPLQRRYDLLLAAMVVHHQASPASFFRHAGQILHRGASLVVAELCPHDQQWAADACGDQWLGFDPDELSAWAQRAGFDVVQSQYLAQKNGFTIQIHRFRLPT